VGYGGNFFRWLLETKNYKPYGSWGNGSAMRVSPVAWAFETEEEVLEHAKLSALPTHNHPEGVKGAQATALAIFMARKGFDNAAIKSKIESLFSYNLNRTVDEIRPTYMFDESCMRTVPEAITCFLEASDYEDTVRNAISLGGDADTLACIAGSIAEARWGVPSEIKNETTKRLDIFLGGLLKEFSDKYLQKI
jgi:ADP-ribosylglycohydrolase